MPLMPFYRQSHHQMIQIYSFLPGCIRKKLHMHGMCRDLCNIQRYYVISSPPCFPVKVFLKLPYSSLRNVFTYPHVSSGGNVEVSLETAQSIGQVFPHHFFPTVPCKTPSNGRMMLIDGSFVIHRAYYRQLGISDAALTKTSFKCPITMFNILWKNMYYKLSGKLHRGYFTYVNDNCSWVVMIFMALSHIIDVLEISPSHVAVVFDHGGNLFGETARKSENRTYKGMDFRSQKFPAYKGNRRVIPDALVHGLQYLKASIKAMAIQVIEVPGVEADDIIGTLALRSVKGGFKVRVVSPDKDFFQILSPSLRLLRIAPRSYRMSSFGLEEFAAKYGTLEPSQFVEIVALTGDNADNIPGVTGLGEVHAVRLITQYGSLENLLSNVDKVPQRHIRKALIANMDLARLSKELATIRTDLPSFILPFDTKDLIFRKPEDNGEKFTSLLNAIGAYAEGFSADPIIRRTLHLWKKLEKHDRNGSGGVP